MYKVVVYIYSMDICFDYIFGYNKKGNEILNGIVLFYVNLFD